MSRTYITYYTPINNSREVFELKGHKKSCLNSTILKVISHKAKKGYVLIHLIMYIYTLISSGQSTN
jgi:hypothetical protein